MSNFLISDKSREEFNLLLRGNPIYGEENLLTGIYKIIGKYTELSEIGDVRDINVYNPDNDIIFKYENIGITTLKKYINHALYGTNIPKISRKELKTLSRKWLMQPVCVSKKSDHIIAEIVSYIVCFPVLKNRIRDYLQKKSYQWEEIILIQYDFLRKRFSRRGRDFDLAAELCLKIDNIDIHEKLT
jgi:hypothetical protein